MVSGSAIASDFKALFKRMTDAAKSAPVTDDWYADELGKLLEKHIKTAAVPVSAVIVKVTGGTGVSNSSEIQVV